MDVGTLDFNVRIDNKELESELKKTYRDIEKATAQRDKATKEKEPLAARSDELGAQLDLEKAKLMELEAEAERLNEIRAQGAMAGANPDVYNQAVAQSEQVANQLAEQRKKVAEIQKEWDGVNNKIDKYDAQIAQANAIIDESTAKAGTIETQLSQVAGTAGNSVVPAFENIKEAVGHVEKRIVTMAKRVFFFSLIMRAFRGILNYTKSLMSTNDQYVQQLAKLKAALATAFQPLYTAAMPALIKVLEILTLIANVAAKIISFIFGTTAKQSAANAKALNKEAKAIGGAGAAADKARKSIAAFDEINKLDDNSNMGGGGGGGATPSMDFSDFDIDEYQKKVAELTAYLSGALLAVGAILAFSGINIPLGLGLMALGAAGLASVISEDWNAMSDEVQTQITNILAIAGGALIALGLILALASPATMKLGIGLIAGGVAALGAAIALNWHALPEAMRGGLGDIIALVSGALLAIGLILALSGVNLPLGIAMIMAGAAGLVTWGALNWDAIKENLVGAWNRIKQWFNTSVAPFLTFAYWQGKLASIGEAIANVFKGAVNTASGYVNRLINMINGIHFSFGGLSMFGQQLVPSFDFKPFNIPNIPMLAQGAVIPPNAPFLAMLGDQHSGNNIETPESLLRQVVREESGSGNNEAVVELLETLIATVAAIKVGDDVIGRAATRYQKNRSRATGV